MTDVITKISADSFTNFENKSTVNITSIFLNSNSVNTRMMFLAYYNIVPNWLRLAGIDVKKANDWFLNNYQECIKECCYIKRSKKHKKLYFNNIYYFLFDDLLISFNAEDEIVSFLYRKTDYSSVDKIVKEINKFKKRMGKKPEIILLVNTHKGLETQIMEISKPRFSIEENYNDDFLNVHQIILSRLRKNNDKGLVLLHGKPGTGKTSYLRYLITKIKKPVIFLPPNMAACITEPGLINVLIDNPNSVFVIEDAENIIIDRNNGGSSSVSALLNLADGLMSDCLNIQIICSFNTDLSRVDSALTRKGRLIAKYEFLELDTPKAQAPSNKLGFSSVITSPMTLAAVYNQNETEFDLTTKRKTIGFYK
ncbi:MAG: ATP-binding protein [Marinilabiliaceae bacterium]|nr:ATP-binding protein [Marinilabiliaceae bacterium]